ncbi:MAG TPA: RusA family crossover junction endodeoxyribonuclease [Candidatus Obscuribacterales bacterium]
MLVNVPGEWDLVDTYHFQLGQEPWKRHTKTGRKPIPMRNYQAFIADLAREHVQTGECLGKLEGNLMVIFTFYTPKPRGDQTNNAKSIEDALNRIAWIDDKQNRQVLILEESAETEMTKVEIYKEKQK